MSYTTNEIPHRAPQEPLPVGQRLTTHQEFLLKVENTRVKLFSYYFNSQKYKEVWLTSEGEYMIIMNGVVQVRTRETDVAAWTYNNCDKGI